MKKIFLLLMLIFAKGVLAIPANVSFAQKGAEDYYASGRYMTDVKLVTTRAKRQLQHAVNSNQHHKKLAIILDIDETALSNYGQIAALYSAVGNVGDVPDPSMLQVINDPFSDPAIAPVLSLYKQAINDGVTVFFLTGRYEYDRAGTVKNLKKVGYTKWKKLILRQPNQYHIPATVYKTAARKKIQADGYDIVLNVGDQYSDLRGGYADNTYKIPDPFYYIP
jgi:acid phosphatase